SERPPTIAGVTPGPGKLERERLPERNVRNRDGAAASAPDRQVAGDPRRAQRNIEGESGLRLAASRLFVALEPCHLDPREPDQRLAESVLCAFDGGQRGIEQLASASSASPRSNEGNEYVGQHPF